LRARQHRWCRCGTTAAHPGIRLTVAAAGGLAPNKHPPAGPLFLSKPGVEHFRRTDGKPSRAIRHRGAPMSPKGAAITPDALNTGLRQCQSESANPVTIGSTGVQTLRRGPLQIATGRFRKAGESTVINHTAGHALGKLQNPVGVRVHRHGRCERVVGHPNLLDLRDMRSVPMHSTTGHMFSKDASVCTADPPTRRTRGRCASVRATRNSLLLYPSAAENGSVPIELATSEFAKLIRLGNSDHVWSAV
jgi:hypothetical protein